jgi:arabinosyltransferase
VTVDVGTDISKGYTKGGQFLQMKVGDSKPAFLAVANAPAASENGLMEFLIKDLPDSTANLVTNLKVGDEVCCPGPICFA